MRQKPHEGCSSRGARGAPGNRLCRQEGGGSNPPSPIRPHRLRLSRLFLGLEYLQAKGRWHTMLPKAHILPRRPQWKTPRFCAVGCHGRWRRRCLPAAVTCAALGRRLRLPSPDFRVRAKQCSIFVPQAVCLRRWRSRTRVREKGQWEESRLFFTAKKSHQNSRLVLTGRWVRVAPGSDGGLCPGSSGVKSSLGART